MSIEDRNISLALTASMERSRFVHGRDIICNKERTLEEYAVDLIADLKARGFKIERIS